MVAPDKDQIINWLYRRRKRKVSEVNAEAKPQSSNQMLKSILTKNVSIVDETPKIDNKSTYVFEFYDQEDEGLARLFESREKNKYWYHYRDNLEEINMFETVYQSLLDQK